MDQQVSEDIGESKANRGPFLYMDPREWVYTTRGMTCEERGYVLETLILMHRVGLTELPDDRYLCAALHMDPRTARRLRPLWDRVSRREFRAPRVPIPQAIRDEVAAEANGLCTYCGKPGASVDHYRPLIEGGVNHIRNYRWACRSCNSRKGGRLPRRDRP